MDTTTRANTFNSSSFHLAVPVRKYRRPGLFLFGSAFHNRRFGKVVVDRNYDECASALIILLVQAVDIHISGALFPSLPWSYAKFLLRLSG